MAKRRSFTNTQASTDREARLRQEDADRAARFNQEQENIFKREEAKARRDAQHIQTQINARQEAALKSQVAQGVARSAREKAADKMAEERNRRHIEDQILEARLHLNSTPIKEYDAKGNETGQTRDRTPDEVDKIIEQSFHPENLRRQITLGNWQQMQATDYGRPQETDEQGRARVAKMRKDAGMPEWTQAYKESLPHPQSSQQQPQQQPQQQVDPKVKAVQEKAQFDAGQFEKRYTNKQKAEISAGEKADQDLESNPNFSAEEKAAGHQMWAQKKLAITPSYLPKLQPFKDGQKIGDSWVDDGVHKTRDADGNIKRIAKMDETASGFKAQTESEQKTREFEHSRDLIDKRFQLASANTNDGLVGEGGTPLSAQHRSLRDIDLIMNNTHGLVDPRNPGPQQQQPQSNPDRDVLKDAIKNREKLNDPKFAQQAFEAYQRLQQPQQQEQPVQPQQQPEQEQQQPQPQQQQFPDPNVENPATGYAGRWNIVSESNPLAARKSQASELQAYKQLLESLVNQPEEGQQ
jgi:hypothetical protein